MPQTRAVFYALMPIFLTLLTEISVIINSMAKQKVVICEDLKAELQSFLDNLTYDKLFVLTDTHTVEKCFPLVNEVPALQNASMITVEASDLHKNLESLSYIWTQLSTKGATRHSLLLNLGGGMVTDMGGFAGATFKRGIRTINVPTTLMASVDAAVGGKTGINFNGLKNEIGAFYPRCVSLSTANFCVLWTATIYFRAMPR